MTLVVPLLRFLFFLLHHVNMRWVGKYLLRSSHWCCTHPCFSTIYLYSTHLCLTYTEPQIGCVLFLGSLRWRTLGTKMAAWHTFPGSPHSYGHSSSLVMPCLFILASSWELQPYRSSRLAFVAEIGPQPMLNVSFIWYLAPPTEMLARCFTVLISLFFNLTLLDFTFTCSS